MEDQIKKTGNKKTVIEPEVVGTSDGKDSGGFRGSFSFRSSSMGSGVGFGAPRPPFGGQGDHTKAWWALRFVFIPLYYLFYLLVVIPITILFISTLLLWIGVKKFTRFISSRFHFN